MSPEEYAQRAETECLGVDHTDLGDEVIYQDGACRFHVAFAIRTAAEQARAEERERLHTLLEACHAAIDPQEWPEVTARLMAEFDAPGCQCADVRERAAVEEREAIAAWHEDEAALCRAEDSPQQAAAHLYSAKMIRARGKAEEVKP